VSNPDGKANEMLAEFDVSSSSVDTRTNPEASWVGDAEFTLTIGGVSPKAYLERGHPERAWEGDAEFILHINGNAFTTEGT
jgi:hypothetical protein